MIDPSDGDEYSTIHQTLSPGAVEYQGRELELKLSAGQHTLSGLVLDRNLRVSRLKITAAENTSLSSSASTLLEVRAGAPPIELHGLTLNGQVVIESSSTVDIAGCRFVSASARRRLQTSASERALMILGGTVTISDAVFEGLPGGAIEVGGGDVSVHTTSFKENQAERDGALLVTGGEVHVHNSTFTGNEGTTLRVIGGNVVLKDNTTLLVGNDQLALNISHGASVTYELPAPLGRYAFIQDSSGIYEFGSGKHLGDFPIACPAGVVGDSSAALSQRSPGCARPCPAGYYCGAGTVVPTGCPVGSYCAAGSPGPTPCKPGTFGQREKLASALECDTCHTGSWCSAGNNISCPKDTYNNLTGQNSQEVCIPCADNAVADPGSSSVSACKCVKDYYDFIDDPGDVECRRCPIGSACEEESGHTLASLPLQPGYWRTSNQSSDVKRCPDASSGDASACANMNGQLCRPWTTGPYCRVCNVTDGSRYFDSGQSACVECGNTAATSLAALAGIILAVLSLLCWCSVRRPCKRLRSLAYQTLLKTRAPLKQLITFYQARGFSDLCARHLLIA